MLTQAAQGDGLGVSNDPVSEARVVRKIWALQVTDGCWLEEGARWVPNNGSGCAWGSIPTFATSEILVALIAWITPSRASEWICRRLQSVAAPGGIVVSYETYAVVRDMVAGRSLPEVSMKGIARVVVPYVIEGLLATDGTTLQVFSEHSTGPNLYPDLGRLDATASTSARPMLTKAISALDQRDHPALS